MTDNLIVNGVPWFDDRGAPVNAHGGCIVEEAGRYYLFGEYKTDDVNTFIGFSCYSSPDLVHWTFERIVLPRQDDGLLGPGRIGERVKVMRCPSTRKYMMYMHCDDLGYTDPHIGMAVGDSIAGEYRFQGALHYRDAPIRRWDMGTFQDREGTGYLLVHEGDIYRLSADYASAEDLIASGLAPGGESPAMLEHEGRYFLMFSNKTSWERNDNYYLSAPTVRGPWTHRGPIAPEGTLTHNSQCTFVLRLHRDGKTVHMYMGDRWSFPHQASAGTYVWMPLDIESDSIALPRFLPSWSPESFTERDFKGAELEVCFSSRERGAFVEVPFSGDQVAVYGSADRSSGYASVEIFDAAGDECVRGLLVDFYSLQADRGLRYVSPRLAAGEYRLRITVTGEAPVWTDKAHNRFGAVDCCVTVDRLVVSPSR
ncbi:glycosyl hydrolase family 43 [Glycomyces buryatensis]|uniref:Glycosyl hydrolase family 43 n=1 Tax=Glycomyces buryatensis TaxID=2570927 RepID=A0A4S8QGB3_9ACTN|nr:glycosyl hydrolase family 43 [Glycomyces buryatensis]THV41985.1 glycosyl hydrolase family 43 [Glycomyces buryatensis]